MKKEDKTTEIKNNEPTFDFPARGGQVRLSAFRLNRGFTLVEMLMALSVVVILGIVVGTFQRSIFSSGSYLQASFKAEDDARSVMKNLISETRSMNFSGLGGYYIEQASGNSFTFYSDINNDGKTERLRYFKEGTMLKRGITYPTGTPVVYTTPEQVSIVVRDIANSSGIFFYYDDSYTGTSNPLPEPIDIVLVRLVKINIPIILRDNKATTSYNITSQVSIRNMKDNL